MTKDTKNMIGVMMLCVTIVCSASSLGAFAHAKTGPSKEDYAALERVKENQKTIAENREEYEAFMKAKNDNVVQNAFLSKDGYTIDWSSMKLVPSFQ